MTRPRCKWMLVALATSALIASATCSDGDKNNGPEPSPTPTPAADSGAELPTTGAIFGTVKSRSSDPLEGVSVSAAGLQATSDAAGAFRLEGVPAGEAVRVVFAKQGYLSTSRNITVYRGGTTGADATLLVVGRTQRVTGLDTATDPAAVVDARSDGLNAQIELQPGSVLNAAGAPVADVNVALTTVVPQDTSFPEIFPGQFLGTPTGGGADVAIESFGFVAVDLTDDSGGELKLDPSKPSSITFPIDPAHDPGSATIELWSLDETTGIWKQEGVATRDTSVTPNVYRATVTHFSFHNIDRPIPAGLALQVTVRDGEDAPVPGAWVSAAVTGDYNSPNGIWAGRETTGEDGKARFPIIPSGNLAVKAGKGDIVASGYGYTTSSSGVIELTIYFPASVTVIVRDNAGNPVAGATVTFGGHGAGGYFQKEATTDADGKVVFENVSRQGGFINANKDNLTGAYEGMNGIPRVVEITLK